MKLGTFRAKGETKIGIVTKSGKAVFALQPAMAAYLASKGEVLSDEQAKLWAPNDMAGFLAAGDKAMDMARACFERFGADDNGEFAYKMSEVKVKAPVRPSKIVGVGGNFAILRNYSGPDFWKFMKPDEPNTFCKAGNCVIGPDEPIVLPKQSNVILSEMELAVIISKPARHVDLESAYDYVAGYSVCFDMTAHDIVGKNIYYFTGKYAELGVGPGAERMYITPGLWVGKSIDTFAPMGPWIVTKDEVPEPGKLHMETKVNGEVLHSGINEMVSDIPHILRWITTWQTLLPGDAIFCGSLPPWKPIVPGDKLQATIEKVGVLTNPCVADPTA